MQNINPQPEAPATKRRFSPYKIRPLHPLFRTFCPAADANTKEPERKCAVAVLFLLLPLVIMLIGLITGSFFGYGTVGDTIVHCYHSTMETLASPPALIGAGVLLLLVAGWLIARSVARRNNAPAH